MSLICKACLSEVNGCNFRELKNKSQNGLYVRHKLTFSCNEMCLDLTKHPVVCSCCVMAIKTTYFFKLQCLCNETSIGGRPPSRTGPKDSVALTDIINHVRKTDYKDVHPGLESLLSQGRDLIQYGEDILCKAYNWVEINNDVVQLHVERHYGLKSVGSLNEHHGLGFVDDPDVHARLKRYNLCNYKCDNEYYARCLEKRRVVHEEQKRFAYLNYGQNHVAEKPFAQMEQKEFKCLFCSYKVPEKVNLMKHMVQHIHSCKIRVT